ncbi:DNA gyrase inhibitor YacG [Ancylobacter sp.]|uniref:DNA gyrase inhibitor YacG n=1 Tax=Ancylobacter sp. TaxID=1872567 RepID=UPI003D142595
MSADTPPEAGGKPCPICGKPMTVKYKPFCSARCADVDLHRWLSGAYAIPVTENDDEDGEEPSLAPRPPREV